MELHGETRKQVYLANQRNQQTQTWCKEKLKTAKIIRTIWEWSGMKRKDCKFFYKKDRRWFNQMDGIYGTGRWATVRRVASPGPRSCWKPNRRVIVWLWVLLLSLFTASTLWTNKYIQKAMFLFFSMQKMSWLVIFQRQLQLGFWNFFVAEETVNSAW